MLLPIVMTQPDPGGIGDVQIKTARRLLGLSKAAIAEKSGISSKTYTKVENGVRVADNVLPMVIYALKRLGIEFVEHGDREVTCRLKSSHG